MTFKKKERLKNAFWEDYKTICEQHYSDLKQLLGDGLANSNEKDYTLK